MRILTLNCQRAQQPGLQEFLRKVIASRRYEFILLQEVDDAVHACLASRHYRVLTSVIIEGTEFAILYRPSYRLVSSEFVSFQHLLRVQGQVGALIGTFRKGARQYTVCSAHFHWGRYFRTRRKSLGAIKEHLQKHKGVKIIAGDFNTLFPYENRAMRRSMQPFTDARYDGYSHNSAYLDRKFPHILFYYAGYLGLRYRSQIDHIFVHGARIAAARIHEIHVSDHRPLEAEIALR